MPVPARRKSNASARRRRAHDALKTRVSSACSQCGSSVKPHHACESCGFYRGRSLKNTEKAVAKTVKKAQKKK